MFEYSIRSQTWQQLKTLPASGNDDGTRAGHAMVLVPNMHGMEQIYIFGGMASEFQNSLIRYDTESDAYERLTPTGTLPTARWKHAMCYVPSSEQIYVFGGRIRNTANNDWDSGANDGPETDQMWKYNIAGQSWAQVSFSGASPIRRSDHCMTYMIFDQKEYLYVFGGQYTSGSARILPNDLYAFDIAAGTWRALATGMITKPRGRRDFGMSAVPYNGELQLVIFGGFDSSAQALNDMWAYSVLYDFWTYIIAENPISARWGFAMTRVPYDGDVNRQDQVFVIAGSTANVVDGGTINWAPVMTDAERCYSYGVPIPTTTTETVTRTSYTSTSTTISMTTFTNSSTSFTNSSTSSSASSTTPSSTTSTSSTTLTSSSFSSSTNSSTTTHSATSSTTVSTSKSTGTSTDTSSMSSTLSLTSSTSRTNSSTITNSTSTSTKTATSTQSSHWSSTSSTTSEVANSPLTTTSLPLTTTSSSPRVGASPSNSSIEMEIQVNWAEICKQVASSQEMLSRNLTSPISEETLNGAIDTYALNSGGSIDAFPVAIADLRWRADSDGDGSVDLQGIKDLCFNLTGVDFFGPSDVDATSSTASPTPAASGATSSTQASDIGASTTLAAEVPTTQPATTATSTDPNGGYNFGLLNSNFQLLTEVDAASSLPGGRLLQVLCAAAALQQLLFT
eukprot:TRINITY_DN9050_c0_g1_i1.p1 TRINITY_DN9050_c0_g1~~TRINITY_DN9050_c0_g1_i1.p1  ORF type:complete len:770 (-),score=84.38 TRINITY_DN9050_c0_g1_i1:148-2181(-)